jgi:hypothetical protein
MNDIVMKGGLGFWIACSCCGCGGWRAAHDVLFPPKRKRETKWREEELRNGGKKSEMAGRYNTTKYILLNRTRRAEDVSVRYRTGQEDFWRTSWSRCISFSALVICWCCTLSIKKSEIQTKSKSKRSISYAATRPAALFTNPLFPIPSHRLHTHPSNTTHQKLAHVIISTKTRQWAAAAPA